MLTPDGAEDGVVVGEWRDRLLVLHGRGGLSRVSWTPCEEAHLVAESDWAPWMAAVSANA